MALLLFHNNVKLIRLLMYMFTIFVLFHDQVEREWNLGNYEAARNASRWAKIWFIVSCVSGVLFLVVVIAIIIAVSRLILAS